jgi:cold shock CspA family protein
MRGVVRAFFPDKGYLFLASEGHPDTFAHIKNCVGVKIEFGAEYEFDLVPNVRRPGQFEAVNVRPVGGREKTEQEKRWVRPAPVAFGQEMTE